jgi:hypothetical protein
MRDTYVRVSHIYVYVYVSCYYLAHGITIKNICNSYTNYEPIYIYIYSYITRIRARVALAFLFIKTGSNE